ncbi:hypothetical protein D9M73_246620 [compost metagenome]
MGLYGLVSAVGQVVQQHRVAAIAQGLRQCDPQGKQVIKFCQSSSLAGNVQQHGPVFSGLVVDILVQDDKCTIDFPGLGFAP